jgi:uncharacterized membrane protein (UPF0127 family)
MVVLIAAVLVGVTASWVVPRLDVPIPFWLSPIETVAVGDRNLRVVRVTFAQGLRAVPTLGGLDAALFVLDSPAPTTAGMGMDEVLVPLDVVFFDRDGRFTDRFLMPTCATDACPAYFPTRPWQFAIEAPAGELEWIPDDALLVR